VEINPEGRVRCKVDCCVCIRLVRIERATVGEADGIVSNRIINDMNWFVETVQKHNVQHGVRNTCRVRPTLVSVTKGEVAIAKRNAKGACWRGRLRWIIRVIDPVCHESNNAQEKDALRISPVVPLTRRIHRSSCLSLDDSSGRCFGMYIELRCVWQ